MPISSDSVALRSDAEIGNALARLDIETLLWPVLVQLAVIIAAARLFGALARRVGQPAVVGEIVAGLVLGPSLLGWLAPELFSTLFRPALPGLDPTLADATLAKVLGVIAQLGLIFLMFLVGLELDYQHLRGRVRSVGAIALSGIAVSFPLGLAITPLVMSRLDPNWDGHGARWSSSGTGLFLALTLAVTAIPVLGRITTELGITRTRVGVVTLAAAGLSDALSWVLLAGIGAAVRASFDPVSLLGMLGGACGFVLFMVLVARPLLVWYFTTGLSRNPGGVGLDAVAVMFVALLLAAGVSSLIGVFAVFGAFVCGAILSDQEALRAAATSRLTDIVNGFFVPVFFTYTGLRTDLTGLSGAAVWPVAGLVIVVATVGKLFGCGVAARISGFSWKEAGVIGAMMNARGLMALVAINLGYELGVVPPSLYAVLVLMAVVTTALTTPVLLALRHGTELEEPIRASRFWP